MSLNVSTRALAALGAMTLIANAAAQNPASTPRRRTGEASYGQRRIGAPLLRYVLAYVVAAFVDGGERARDRVRSGDAQHPPATLLAGLVVAVARAHGERERRRVARCDEPVGAAELGQRADRAAGDGQAGGHRLGGGEAERLGRARRDHGERGAGAQARELGVADAPGERRLACRAQLRAAPRAAARRRRRRAGRPPPRTRRPRRRPPSPAPGATRRARGCLWPRSSARRPRARRGRRRAASSASIGAPRSRSRRAANALGTTTTSACSSSRRCQSASDAA